MAEQRRRMYRLVVCDLDGTLLNAEHRLGEYSRAVLEGVRRRGVGILLATGRHHQDIQGFSARIGGDGYLISSNGAAVHDAAGYLLHRRAIPADCLDFLLRDPVFAQVHVNVYGVDGWLVETPKPSLLRYHRESGFGYRVTDFTALTDAPVLKVFYHAEDPADLPHLERLILDRHGERLVTTHALPMVLEVMARGVSKGDALARVVERLGLGPEDVIAFGDGRNDLEMLHYAGKGVLMGNADPSLRAALPDLEVIGSNAEEAVAVYLARLFECEDVVG